MGEPLYAGRDLFVQLKGYFSAYELTFCRTSFICWKLQYRKIPAKLLAPVSLLLLVRVSLFKFLFAIRRNLYIGSAMA